MAAVALGLTGCAALGGVIDQLGTERPPAPLDAATVASDARISTAGIIAGSFVGEGTSRAVHLLSSDTTLIAALARRARPADQRRGDIWQWLAARGTVAVSFDPAEDSVRAGQIIMAASPEGHTRVRLIGVLLHGSSCGPRGAQAELIVVDAARGGGPSLRGPVVGAFFDPEHDRPRVNRTWREPPGPASPALEDSLLRWTRAALDSLVSRRAPRRALPLEPLPAPALEINSLADEDAADVQPFRLEDGRVRYAVSLRERRRTADGVEVLAAIVMAWDQTGGWRQVIFRPTLLEYRRGRPARALGGSTLPLFWRRLGPVSGFAYRRDYLWMEQVDVESHRVLWVILEPRGNTVVAAAEMEGPC
jgi:hypothetical protein